MAAFTYRDIEFEGLNPNGIIFQRQTDPYSCWAACLVNAQAALCGMSTVTDEQIVDLVYPPNVAHEFSKKVLAYNEYPEAINMARSLTSLEMAARDKKPWPLSDPNAHSELQMALNKEMPVILSLSAPDEDIGHDVLALAFGQRAGPPYDWYYMVYDPYDPTSGSTPATVSGAIAMALHGGLILLKEETVRNHGTQAIPLKRTS